MKITYNWLKEYIEFDLSAAELAERLTNVGFEVEEYFPLIKPFSGVVVGKVLSKDKHPDADKLSICRVSDGENEYQVVCGASNVEAGQTIPFARVGALLDGGNFKIKKAKIRGQESFGMICSREELGLEEHSDGIWPMEGDFVPGQDVYELLNRDADFVFDFFITPNRADCFSLFGIAREVAAITGQQLKKPDLSLTSTIQEKTSELVSVKIEDTEGCPRYAARVVRNIKLGPSPQWMQQRLSAVGMRPINNIVDITNYVLLETGQPLHAFDLNEISDNKIIVRSSKKDEKFTTLDDKERIIPENTVMICDNQRAVAIGGIMGGQNSEVSGSTRDILLESAYFNPLRISNSSRKLGLSSEASQRFEKGVDPQGTLYALNRAADLIARIAGGQILSDVIDVNPVPYVAPQVPFRVERVNRLLGTDFSSDFINGILSGLDIEVSEGVATPPSWRVDIKIEADIAEEVGRCVNYSNLPVSENSQLSYNLPPSTIERRNRYFRDHLRNLNIQEAFTASMYKAAEAYPFRQGQPITILNPISDDMTTMRPSLLPGLLKAVNYNINRNITDVRLFESGRVFTNYVDDALPDQPYHIAMVLSGSRVNGGWDTSSDPVDFYDIKGYLEAFLENLALDKFRFILYDKSSYFSAGETLAIEYRGKQVGLCGKLNRETCAVFGIEQEVFAFELNTDLLSEGLSFERKYKPVSRFPYAERDMAFVLDKKIAAADILRSIRKNGGPLLNELFVFDVFEGGSLPADKKSVAFRMRFQSVDRTLADKEVDSTFRKLITVVSKEFNATLRD